MTAILSVGVIPSDDELRELYDAVGWSNYTRAPHVLRRGLQGSSRVVTARDNETLVGLARIVSDGATIAYLQDVLVHPQVQRSGLGRKLVEAAFAPYTKVRQHVLLTDDQPYQRAFYEDLGFVEIRDVDDAALRAFVRIA